MFLNEPSNDRAVLEEEHSIVCEALYSRCGDRQLASNLAPIVDRVGQSFGE